MKKFYFLSFALCMFLFTACSDDKEENWAEKISKEYKGNDLSLSINDTDIEDSSKAIEFITSDLEKGNLTLKNMFPGESEITISNMTLTQDQTNNKLYSFTGESKNENREITVKGVVGNGMELDVTFKVVSPIVNSWRTNGNTLSVNITPIDDDAKIHMNGVMSIDKEIPLIGRGNIINPTFTYTISMASSIVFGTLVTLELQMNENGNMIAKWSPGLLGSGFISEGQSKEGVVKYNIVDKQIYVTVDITDLITGMIGGGSGNMDLSQLPSGILDLLPVLTQEGLPLNIEINENSLTANVTKEMMVPYLDIIIPLVNMLMADAELPEMLEQQFGINSTTLPPFLEEVSRVINESPKFDLNINLSRVENTTAE